MKRGLNVAFFGSSLVSAYWNGAATYYRGIVKALHARGHRVTFYEPDAYDRQKHRDIPDPDWAKVVVYSSDGEAGVQRVIDEARSADLIVKASGVGVFDELLEAAVPEMRRPGALAIFWDVDAPATLDRMKNNAKDPFRELVPKYDLVLTYGGGDPVIEAYTSFGARRCVPIYNALDSSTHHPVAPDKRFEADLGFLGNRLPDREARVEEFFLRPAATVRQRFLLGGSGWGDKPMPQNVHYAGHVYTKDHNAFNCTPRAVLNISRESMATYGFSPATRVFEAAGAAACIITDYWRGVECFLEPEKEILIARSGLEVAEHLARLSSEQARAIGDAAYSRVLSEHTYNHRVEELERVLFGNSEKEKTTVHVDGQKQNCAQTSKACERLRIVMLGLSITSSWGNGHATTYRGLVRELVRRGHDVIFLERDVPWYADNRDLANPPYGRTELYTSFDDLRHRFEDEIKNADFVLLGSFVAEGISIGEWVLKTAQASVGFYDIDTPVTLAKLEQGQCEYISKDLIRKYHLYLSFTGGPTLARLESELGSQSARALYCSADTESYFPEPQKTSWHLGFIGTYTPDRQPMLEELLLKPARKWKRGRMVVAGSQYPPEMKWPANVERIEHLPPPKHRAFYNSQLFTLNLTRADMARAGYSPSIRLFEAAACGTPIISDNWPSVEQFFEPGREIIIARDSGDVLNALRNMSDSERLAIGARARARVLERHTAAHRAAELESYILEAVARFA